MTRKIDLDGERNFENEKIAGKNPRAKQSKYYWATGVERDRYLESLVANVEGKRVLEIGCSTGSLAALLAPLTRTYIGTDISDKAIEMAQARNLPRSTFMCADGHNLPLPDESVDCVVVDALLHHLDFERAIEEIHRLLRPGGVLFFNEPLGTNPLFGLYRRFTPKSRTVDERPLTRGDLAILHKHFQLTEVSYFGLFSILSAFFGTSYVRSALTRVDRLLSRTPLKYLFWQVAGYGVRRSGEHTSAF